MSTISVMDFSELDPRWSLFGCVSNMSIDSTWSLKWFMCWSVYYFLGLLSFVAFSFLWQVCLVLFS